MRAITLSILLAAIISAAPAVAKNNSSQATENQVGAAASEGSPKKICRRLAETGTRIVERVCLTKEEWKQVEQIK